jgi:xylitol oxidase
MHMQNWAGTFAFTAARLYRPTSIGEVQRVVAASTGIRAIGTRHSFNGIADSPADQVDLSGIDPDIVIDRERMTATVGGAISYGDLSLFLHRQGFALHNLASLPQISVAGAIATATHGSGDGNKALSSAVVGLEMVVSDGSLRRVQSGNADFEAMVVSLGAFGIVTRVTLAIEPTFDIRQDAFVDMPWDELLAKFDAISSAAYSFSIFTKWSGLTASRIWLKTREDARPGERDVTRLEPSLGLKLGLPYSVPATVEDPLALLNPFGVAGPWLDRLTHTRREIDPLPAHQIQSEYMVARPQFDKAVAIIRAMADRIDPLLHATEIRTIAADEFWLSAAYRRDAIALHFTWKKETDAVDAITRELEAALIPLGARPHWGKLIHADAATLAPLYPRMADFRALARRHDSEAKFRNAYLEKHVFG